MKMFQIFDKLTSCFFLVNLYPTFNQNCFYISSNSEAITKPNLTLKSYQYKYQTDIPHYNHPVVI